MLPLGFLPFLLTEALIVIDQMSISNKQQQQNILFLQSFFEFPNCGKNVMNSSKHICVLTHKGTLFFFNLLDYWSSKCILLVKLESPAW